jgi:hypothetical protein
MKKFFILLTAFAMSLVLFTGCSEDIADLEGSDKTGAVIDLVDGSFNISFDGLTSYAGSKTYYDTNKQKISFPVIDGMLYPTYTLSNNVTKVFASITASSNPGPVVFFGVNGPNYMVASAAEANLIFPMKYSVTCQLSSLVEASPEGVSMVIQPVQGNTAGTANGAIVAKLTNLGSGFGVLLLVGTTANATGFLPVAFMPIAGFAAETNYTIEIEVANNASLTVQGPDLAINVNGTELYSYAAETNIWTPAVGLPDANQDAIINSLSGGFVTDDGVPGDGFTAASIWHDTWVGFIYGASQNTSTKQIGFAAMIDVGSTTSTAPSIKSVSISK